MFAKVQCAGMSKSDNDEEIPAGQAPDISSDQDDKGKTSRVITVAIGSSAGGLAALTKLFDALPADLGTAFVIVAHLDPTRPSDLVSILSRHTAMTVQEISGRCELMADHVYVAAPDREVLATDHVIETRPFKAPRGRRTPIDTFFLSLAKRHRDGVAMILSGGGADGAVGVRAIKEAGGVVMVQDPDEAAHDSMPRAAIATGCADFVLPVRGLAARLAELIDTRHSVERQPLPVSGGLSQSATPDRHANSNDHAEAVLHYRALEDLAPPSLLVDSELRVLHLSDTAGRYLLHPGETPSDNIMQIILPDLRPYLRRSLHQAFEKGEPSLTPPIRIAFDARIRRVLLNVRPVLRDGSVTHCLVVFNEGSEPETLDGPVEPLPGTVPDGIVAQLDQELDVAREQLRSSRSGHDLTTEELQASKEELQTLNRELAIKVGNLSSANSDLQNLIAATEGGTLFLDPDLRIKLFTRGVGEYFNITCHDIGRPITDFSHRLLYDGFVEDTRTLLNDLVPIEREVAINGDAWVLVRMRPYRTLEDRIDGVVITIVDVTRLHKAEAALRETNEHFRALVNATSYAVYRMGPDWSEMRELDGNGFMHDTTEPDPAWMDKYIDPADQPMVGEAIATAIQTKSVFEVEHRVKRPDGSLGWTHSRAVPMLDDAGEIVEWFGAATDITEWRKSADELAQARRLETIGRLASAVAHDFNNLLTIVMANIELAEMRISDDEAKLFLEQAVKAAGLGTTLKQRLLSLAGRQQLDPETVVLSTHVADVCGLLERVLGGRVKLDSDIASDLWHVYVDPIEVDTALMNLALNARDAMPEGGEIVIRARNVSLDAAAAADLPGAKPGDHVCLSVSDNGLGMSEKVLERASDAFFSTKENDTGAGLGLFSVKSFVQQSGGFMHIESTPGDGARISLYLPRTTRCPVIARADISVEEARRGRGERVLLVEDDTAVLETTRQRLQALGYEVRQARNAAEAIDCLADDRKIRVVFSDILMPGKRNGLELAQWIRAEMPHVGVLLTSAYRSELINLPGAALLNDTEVLEKPYSLIQLASALNRAMGQTTG
ncbi:Blue-light-activated protein (plasmid) [Paracoccaceae bacterium]|nr:Blue-light-activated protein [Paracoccaceae bacterium]